MSNSLHPMLNIAIKAARAAGAIINRGSQDLDLLKVTHKGPNDFVSEVDQAAEAAIIETLLTAYPGHGILAEESGREHGSKDSEFTWIIDPLDGTTNFLHGFPVYAVSIALAHRGVVQQAVVYDPTRNDLFFASRGRGAFLNDRRLRVSKRTRLADSLIGTGFPYRRGDSFHRYVKMFEAVMQSCAGVRRPGAAALDLCYVAAGWYDGFFEMGLNPWDVAAGSLIITEAGGLVGNFTGEADFLYQREIVAGAPKVYGQLVTLLAPYSRAIAADDAAAHGAASGLDPATGTIGQAGNTGALAQAAVALRSADVLAKAADGSAKVVEALADALTPAVDASTAEAQPPVAPARERKPVRIRKIEPPVEAPADAPMPEHRARDPRPRDSRAPDARPADRRPREGGFKPPRPGEGRPRDGGARDRRDAGPADARRAPPRRTDARRPDDRGGPAPARPPRPKGPPRSR